MKCCGAGICLSQIMCETWITALSCLWVYPCPLLDRICIGVEKKRGPRESTRSFLTFFFCPCTGDTRAALHHSTRGGLLFLISAFLFPSFCYLLGAVVKPLFPPTRCSSSLPTPRAASCVVNRATPPKSARCRTAKGHIPRFC